jgi:hypothetical protein
MMAALMSNISTSARPAAGTALALALCLATLPGCYNDAVLLAARQEATNLVLLDEVDMGEFRITLPYVPGEARGTVVDFHVFGQVARRDRDKAAKALALQGPELRYRVMLLVRGLSRKELEEPTLKSLRRGLASVTNAALDRKLVKSVGFYRFAFTNL